MRTHTTSFRLSAAMAAAGLVIAQAVPRPAAAQPAPPPAAAPTQPYQQTADPPERVGRLAAVNGAVSYHGPDADQWIAATLNYPVASGDAFWTQPGASAQLEIGASRIAMAGGTELDVATLDQDGLQATAAQGELDLHLLNLAPGESWSVQTPRGLVTLSGPGRYDIAAGDTQDPTTVTVLEGAAQVSGPDLALQVGPGQTASITGTDTFAGTVGPAQTDAFLAAMIQAERPPPVQAAAPAIVAQMPGGEDLSAYGAWSASPDYGEVWYPQVAPGWVPYSDGQWAYVAPWGWTWIDASPWGFAPAHYGRWVQIGGRWGWTPGVVAVGGPPVYAPALVAFFGVGVGVGIGAALASGRVGWIPLGPREAYHPWYRASPGYLRAVNAHSVSNITTINRNVTIGNFVNRRAATVVPASALAASRPVRQVAQRADPQVLASARPVAGREPVRPTAATAGITPGLVHRMNLAPAQAGVAATPRAGAPGPLIHAQAAGAPAGQLGRPALREPASAALAIPGSRQAPGIPGAAGGLPLLRTPGSQGAPPSIVHPPGVAVARPAVPGAEVQRLPAVVHPGREFETEHPRLAAPNPPPHPAIPAAVPHAVPAPVPQVHVPTAFHAAPPPEVHAPAPAPQAHFAPPAPQMRVAPPPEVHVPAPAPQAHFAPPAPQMRVAPPPEVHVPAPAPQAHFAPPAPQMRVAPPPPVHVAPPPPQHAAPAAERAKRPGEP